MSEGIYNSLYPRLHRERGPRSAVLTFYPRSRYCANPYSEGFISSSLTLKDFLKKTQMKSNMDNCAVYLHFGPWYTFAGKTDLSVREQIYLRFNYKLKIYTNWNRRIIKDVTFQ